MAAFGVQDFRPPDWMLEEDGPGEFGVLAENLDAVNAFFACATQWQHDRNDAAIGLRYEALELVLRHSRVADADDAFERVRVMERAALREFAKMRKS
jgi:hypothetical protein